MPVPQEHFPVIGWSHPDNVNEQFGKVLGIFKTDPAGNLRQGKRGVFH